MSGWSEQPTERPCLTISNAEVYMTKYNRRKPLASAMGRFSTRPVLCPTNTQSPIFKMNHLTHGEPSSP